jgi:hypothetical protein
VLGGGHAVVKGLAARLSFWFIGEHWERFLLEVFGFCLSAINPTVFWQWVVDPLLFKMSKKHSVIHPILKMKKVEGRTTAGQQMTTVSEIRNVDVHKFYPVRYICNSRWLFWQLSTAVCLISLCKCSSTRGFCRFEQLLNTFFQKIWRT